MRCLWAAAILLVAYSLFSFAVQGWGKHNREPGKHENAKITWGTMCRDGQCRPAALLYGTIAASASPIIDLLATRPDVQTLCLDSNGGNSAAATALAAWLIDHNYDTCIAQIGNIDKKLDPICASACTMIFVEGQRRFLAPTARFQIHSATLPYIRGMYEAPSDDSLDAPPPPTFVRFVEPVIASVAQLGKWITSLSLPASKPRDRLTQEAAKTPSYRLKTVSPGQLYEWGVLTEPSTHEIVFTKSEGS